jgi:hypothetical protein
MHSGKMVCPRLRVTERRARTFLAQNDGRYLERVMHVNHEIT